MSTKPVRTNGEVISALHPGKFATLCKVIPAGSLQARRLSTGTVKLYWRFTFAGNTERVEIGPYDGSLPPKSMAPQDGRWSLAAAKAAAAKLAHAHVEAKEQGGHVGLMQARQDAKAKAKAEAEAAQARAAADHDRRNKFTLATLLRAYWLHIEQLGRPAHRDAKSILTNHAIDAWPELANMPAADISDEQIADMMRRLIGQGKERTANKLRAYMRAAFETARKARTSAKIPVAFKGFGIKHNPAAGTDTNAAANKPDKNPLSPAELRTYWACIKDMEGIRGVALKLHLLTGGQRIEQLVKLKSAHVTADSITIFDSKGRPGQTPREHMLPLIPAAAEAIKSLDLSGDFALTTGGGENVGTTHLAATTLSGWAAQAVGDAIPGFKAKRVRSGVESLLSSIGVSKDTRGRLQSHGISGVQDRHYDAYDYMAEKRAALDALHLALTEQPADNVRPIRLA